MTEPPAELYYKVRRSRMMAAAAWSVILALAVLAGVYGMQRLRSNPAGAAAAACAPAVATAGRIAPLAQGQVAALAVAHTPFLVPDLDFKDAAGRERKLADWRGRTVLL